MAEMDIYMRRRLVALGGLVAFFIIFVLLVKSCGGDDEPAQVTNEEPAGATGETGAALPVDEFIVQADAICGPANLAVSELDPADTNATQQEYDITRRELKDLRSLELAEPDRNIDQFLAGLGAVVDALGAKAAAVESGDVAAQDAAQLEIDTAEVEAREAGEQAGFSDCGDFLDAGETPTGGDGGGVTDETTDSGAVAPTDTTVVPPADTSTPAPPVDDGTTAPPTDGDGGGITP